MTTLHLSVINDRDTYADRHHMARKFLQGYYDREGYRKAVRALVAKRAAAERQRFGSKFKPQEITEAAKLAADYITQHEIECIAGDYDRTRPVEAVIRRWFDKANGNSYFSLRLNIPLNSGSFTQVYKPMAYGYGAQPEWEAVHHLIEMGIFEENPPLKTAPSNYPIRFDDRGYGLKRDL